MSLIATSISLQPKMPPACSFKAVSCISSLLLIPPQLLSSCSPTSDSLVPSNDTLRSKTCDSVLHSWQLYAVSGNSEPVPERKPNPDSKSKPKKRITHPKKTTVPQKEAQNPQKIFPGIIPRKPRRGRKSEAAAVEDFVRDSLGRTFASIREQNPEIRIDDEEILRKRANDGTTSDISDDEDDGVGERGQEMVVEEDNSNWPLDADVGWGIRASEYFENHPIKNVVAEDGTEIDWEGELDDNWVQEINCLEWETFAFHPSPMIVLVFERYNRATDNWKLLKEIEKALKVYWNAKNRLPPRAVKLDINIERDLAYALKVRECPQVLFLRGHKILYREKEFRNADELVRMIAYFYYNAKKPSWIDDAALTH